MMETFCGNHGHFCSAMKKKKKKLFDDIFVHGIHLNQEVFTFILVGHTNLICCPAGPTDPEFSKID